MNMQIPVALRVHLTHAAMQAIAEEANVDILHIKGPAVDEALLPTRTQQKLNSSEMAETPIPRASTDADVLVRPEHVRRFLKALKNNDWTVVTHFNSGSAFGHAASLWHNELGYVDIHRRFPGINTSSSLAFEALWADRTTSPIAHQQCFVPSVSAQRLILLLHAARGGKANDSDITTCWRQASSQEQVEVRELSYRLHSEVALAAAIGGLDNYVDDPSYDLWKVFEEGSPQDRLSEWKARFKAAPTLWAKVRVVSQSLLVNTDHLQMRLGRKATFTEMVVAYVDRARKLALALAAPILRRLQRKREG